MEKVQQALQVQNSPQSTREQIHEVNTFLEDFQKRTEAWTISDQLLAIPNEPANHPLQTFAAQTIKKKIQYDWTELPAQAHNQLRQSLLTHVLRFGQGPMPVLTQLSLAVGVMALHMESWTTVVSDLVQNFTNPPDQAASKLPCLLELLHVLPEEAENYKVSVLPARRTQCRAMLYDAGPQVLQLLIAVCENEQMRSSAPMMEKVLKCVTSWMRHVNLPSDTLAASPLLAFGFQALGAPQLFDAAADVIVEAIAFSSQDYAAHQQLIGQIVPKVLQLRPNYEQAANDGDDDTARAYCRIFTELGEKYIELILSPNGIPWAAHDVVRAVLRGASHPDAEIAEITFNFWFKLSNEVAGTGQCLNDIQREECKAQFSPLFLELIDALRALAEFPDDSGSWDATQLDDFKRFRYSVGDAINDSCQVATSAAVIERLYNGLSASYPAFQADNNGQWKRIEAFVYCLRQSGTKDRNFYNAARVGEVLALLPQLPQVGELTSTAIRTVGTHSDWLQQNPDLLPQMLSFVSNGLRHDRTAAAASQAMKNLCEKCAPHLAHADTMQQLLTMYQGTLQLQLSAADRVDLIAALSFVVSQMPLEQVLPVMQAIARPLLERLEAILTAGTSAVGEVSPLLDQLCSLLREVSPADGGADNPALQDIDHPSVTMLQSAEVSTLLAEIFRRHGGNSQCMEKLCRCYKHTAKVHRDAFSKLVPQLLPQITGWYEQYPHSCFVYVVNWMLTFYSRRADFLPLFANSFGRVAQATFNLLRSGENAITDNPDVVDDFFELCNKVLRHVPLLLLEPDQLLLTVFDCGCAGLHILHREAGRSVTSFFEALLALELLIGTNSGRAEQIMQSRVGSVQLPEPARNRLREVIAQRGPTLTSRIVEAIAGKLPQQRVRFISPLLKLLAEVDWNACMQWTSSAVQALPAGAHADGGQWVNITFTSETMKNDKELIKAAENFHEACKRRRIL